MVLLIPLLKTVSFCGAKNVEQKKEACKKKYAFHQIISYLYIVYNKHFSSKYKHLTN